jgi:hypothetical protein
MNTVRASPSSCSWSFASRRLSRTLSRSPTSSDILHPSAGVCQANYRGGYTSSWRLHQLSEKLVKRHIYSHRIMKAVDCDKTTCSVEWRNRLYISRVYGDKFGVALTHFHDCEFTHYHPAPPNIDSSAFRPPPTSVSDNVFAPCAPAIPICATCSA